MKTDTSERGLERLICTALSGHPCDPPKEGSVGQPRVGYGGVGWSCGNPHDYDREYCVDLVQLAAFLRTTQPEASALTEVFRFESTIDGQPPFPTSCLLLVEVPSGLNEWDPHRLNHSPIESMEQWWEIAS